MRKSLFSLFAHLLQHSHTYCALSQIMIHFACDYAVKALLAPLRTSWSWNFYLLHFVTLTSLCCGPCTGVSDWLRLDSFRANVQSPSPFYVVGEALAPPPSGAGTDSEEEEREGFVFPSNKSASEPEKHGLKYENQAADRQRSAGYLSTFPLDRGDSGGGGRAEAGEAFPSALRGFVINRCR